MTNTEALTVATYDIVSAVVDNLIVVVWVVCLVVTVLGVRAIRHYYRR